MESGDEIREAPHVTKLSHGMVEKNTILSIWDVEHGEVYSVPKGISRENLEEFFRDLVERIIR